MKKNVIALFVLLFPTILLAQPEPGGKLKLGFGKVKGQVQFKGEEVARPGVVSFFKEREGLASKIELLSRDGKSRRTIKVRLADSIDGPTLPWPKRPA